MSLRNNIHLSPSGRQSTAMPRCICEWSMPNEAQWWFPPPISHITQLAIRRIRNFFRLRPWTYLFTRSNQINAFFSYLQFSKAEKHFRKKFNHRSLSIVRRRFVWVESCVQQQQLQNVIYFSESWWFQLPTQKCQSSEVVKQFYYILGIFGCQRRWQWP